MREEGGTSCSDVDAEDEPRLELRPVVEVPFSAELTGARGERVWRVEGRTEVADEVVGHSAFIGIARNVVAALLHDGWVAQRIDPDDPPPPAPEIRLEPVR